MIFSELTLSEMTFGDLKFGEMAFGEVTFGESSGHSASELHGVQQTTNSSYILCGTDFDYVAEHFGTP